MRKGRRSGFALKTARRLSKMKYILIALVLLVNASPSALQNQSDIAVRTLVLSVGIDKTLDDEYEMCAHIITPQMSEQNPEIVNVICAKGKTLRECEDGISVKSGRLANMVYCSLIVLGREIAENDALTPIDYFLRANMLRNNAILFVSEGKAYEEINKIAGLDDLTSFSLGRFLKQYRMYNFRTCVTIKDFAERYLLKGHDAFLPSFTLKSRGEVNGGCAAAEINPDIPKTEFCGESRTAIFKKGRLQRFLSGRETAALLWLDKKSSFGRLDIENVEFRNLSNATLSMTVNKKGIKLKTVFENGKPVLDVKINIDVTVNEINGDHEMLIVMDSEEKRQIIKTLDGAVYSKIKEGIELIVGVMRDERCDFYGMEERFYRHDKRGYDKYMSEDSSRFLPADMTVRVKTKSDIFI